MSPVSTVPTVAERTAMNEAVDRALKAAHQSGKAGIAASVLKGGRIVAIGENEVNLQSDPTKHAEMLAITRAAKALGTTDLSDCVIVSTLQPCEMCLSALRFAGVLSYDEGGSRSMREPLLATPFMAGSGGERIGGVLVVADRS